MQAEQRHRSSPPASFVEGVLQRGRANKWNDRIKVKVVRSGELNLSGEYLREAKIKSHTWVRMTHWTRLPRGDIGPQLYM